MSTLAGEFAMKDLGPLTYFLGVSVMRNGDNLFISQQAYARDIIHRAGMDSCKPAATPVDTQTKLGDTSGPLFDDPTTYRSLTHWNALKRIQGTADFGLHLHASSSLSIRAYTDADGPVVLILDDPRLVIVFIWVITWFPGPLSASLPSPVLVLKPNIEVSPTSYPKYVGSEIFFLNFDGHYLRLLWYTVTT
ncbi:uncharacterized mitochondrial protein AtMg00810-like [Helianthus annuus]|uniref:uncharacterized mitochondrial protein AtMg00810-like n=1 Tax=Helianthus annuus TaxID=4232 RepID=UPI000B8FB02F|nr:uncharacterized mitochondrial protein AtMg00810-like [Helianthus annuus]